MVPPLEQFMLLAQQGHPRLGQDGNALLDQDEYLCLRRSYMVTYFIVYVEPCLDVSSHRLPVNPVCACNDDRLIEA